MLVYWETTQACPLACRHCRASAVADAHPLQLSHSEGIDLLEQIVSFGRPYPHIVLTGGDPLRRKDLKELIAYGKSLGLDMSITPAASPELTREVVFQLKEWGIHSMALSLDASTAERHDSIRQVPGCFETTIQAAKWAGEAGIPLQINTLLSDETVDDLPAVYELLHSFPLMRWSLFFLISVGRGKQLNEISPEKGEEVMNWVFDLAQKAPFQIKTTEAPSYRRIAKERMKSLGMSGSEMRETSVHRGFGVRDGNGIVFVSHLGAVYPSGFLPVYAGNVRSKSLVEIYRDSTVFQAVRDVNSFEGKCGDCEFRKVCGGSRARAYAHSGSYTASDPLCPYQPQGKKMALAS